MPTKYRTMLKFLALPLLAMLLMPLFPAWEAVWAYGALPVALGLANVATALNAPALGGRRTMKVMAYMGLFLAAPWALLGALFLPQVLLPLVAGVTACIVQIRTLNDPEVAEWLRNRPEAPWDRANA